jgi:hypothetical protein
MENALDVWNDLKERFAQSDLVRIAELQQELYSLKQDSRSVTEFYSDLKLIWEELEIYLPMPSCSCRVRCSCEAMRAARHNHMLLYVIRFLTGLNDNFAMVKSQILLMDPLPPLNKVFSMVLQHERQGKIPRDDEAQALINMLLRLMALLSLRSAPFVVVTITQLRIVSKNTVCPLTFANHLLPTMLLLREGLKIPILQLLHLLELIQEQTQ